MLLAGNAALAVGPWFVRVADSGPISAGFWRVALAAPTLFLLARWQDGASAPPVPRKVAWAVALGGIGFAGWAAMMVFLVELAIGYAYAWKKGALEWE